MRKRIEKYLTHRVVSCRWCQATCLCDHCGLTWSVEVATRRTYALFHSSQMKILIQTLATYTLRHIRTQTSQILQRPRKLSAFPFVYGGCFFWCAAVTSVWTIAVVVMPTIFFFGFSTHILCLRTRASNEYIFGYSILFYQSYWFHAITIQLDGVWARFRKLFATLYILKPFP